MLTNGTEIFLKKMSILRKKKKTENFNMLMNDIEIFLKKKPEKCQYAR